MLLWQGAPCVTPSCCGGTSGKRFRPSSGGEGVVVEVVLGSGCCAGSSFSPSLWGLFFCFWGLEVDTLVWAEKDTAALRAGDVPRMTEAERDNCLLDFLTLGGDKGTGLGGVTLFRWSSRVALNTLIVCLSPGVSVGWALPSRVPHLGLAFVSEFGDSRSSSSVFRWANRLFL